VTRRRTPTPGPRESRIPWQAAVDRRLVGCDLQVLNLLGRSTDAEGWCRRRQSELARELGVIRPTITRALKRLVAAGYVIQEHVFDEATGSQQASWYRIVTPEAEPEFDLGGAAPEAAKKPDRESSTIHPPESSAIHPRESSGDSPPESPGDSPLTTMLNDSPHFVRGEHPAPKKRSGHRRRDAAGRPAVPEQRELRMLAPVKPRPAARTPIPESWEPGPTEILHARMSGLDPPEIAEEAARFRRWHRSQGTLSADWPAEWELQVAHAVRRKGEGDGRGAGTATAGGGGGERPAGRSGRLAAGFAALRRADET